MMQFNLKICPPFKFEGVFFGEVIYMIYIYVTKTNQQTKASHGVGISMEYQITQPSYFSNWNRYREQMRMKT